MVLSAVCSGGCANGGTCIDPEECQCVEGWTGTTCENGIMVVLYESCNLVIVA